MLVGDMGTFERRPGGGSNAVPPTLRQKGLAVVEAGDKEEEGLRRFVTCENAGAS